MLVSRRIYKFKKSKFLLNVLILGENPNWIGSFNVTPLCNQQACCCLTGQIKVTEVAHFFMTISGKVTGQCNGLSTFFLPAMKPSNYSTELPIVGVVNLSEDSSTITATSPLGTRCNGRAVRQ